MRSLPPRPERREEGRLGRPGAARERRRDEAARAQRVRRGVDLGRLSSVELDQEMAHEAKALIRQRRKDFPLCALAVELHDVDGRRDALTNVAIERDALDLDLP